MGRPRKQDAQHNRRTGRAPELPDFKALFEASPGRMLVINADLIIVAASESYLQATKTKRDEIIGRQLFDALPDNPDDPNTHATANTRASMERVMRYRVADSMAVQRHDIQRPQSEGGRFEERYWSAINAPLLGRDGKVEFILHRVEDVTELVRVKEVEAREREVADELRDRARLMEMDVLARSLELRKANERLAEISAHRERLIIQLEQLLNLAPDATLTVDQSGRIVRASEQALTLFGYERGEMIGMEVEKLIPRGLRTKHKLHRSDYRSVPSVRPMGTGQELRGLRKDGTEVRVEISLSPLHTELGLIVTASIRDVTERKQRERLREQVMEAREDEAQYHGDEYRRALHDYRQILRHRIANPLTIITGMATTLLEQPDIDRATHDKMVTAIRNAGNSLRQEALVEPQQQDAVEHDLHAQPRFTDSS